MDIMNRAEFVKMIEKKLKECGDINNAPFGLDYYESTAYMIGKAEGLQWILEILPENFNE